MLVSGVDGASGRELIMFAGGADGVSGGARVSQVSSDSTFIVLIFFFLLSSLIFFLGKDRSKSAVTIEINKDKQYCQCHSVI